MPHEIAKQLKTVIHWFHGWGGHPDIWKSMIHSVDAETENKKVQHLVYNRGYYYGCGLLKPQANSWSTSDTHIIISHSMGGLFVPRELAEIADHWIMLSGFRDFHEIHPQRSRKALMRMIDAFGVDPHAVLDKFYENMMMPDKISPVFPTGFLASSPINLQLLHDDLILLNEATIPTDYLANCIKLTIFHGNKDVIVSSDHAEILCKTCNSVRVVIDQAGHGIPLTHSAFIVSLLQL